MAVLYSTCCSDNISITVDIAVACIPLLEVASGDAINISVNWSKLSSADKETYARDIDVIIIILLLNFITDSLLHTCAGKYDSCPNYKDYNKDTTLVF